MITHTIVFVVMGLLLVSLGFAAGYARGLTAARKHYRQMMQSEEFNKWQALCVLTNLHAAMREHGTQTHTDRPADPEAQATGFFPPPGVGR